MKKGGKPLLGFLEGGRCDELVEAVPDQIRKIGGKDFGEAAIGDANFAFERKREDGLVEAIDQLAIVVLRAGDDVDELFELVFASSSGSRRGSRMGSSS